MSSNITPISRKMEVTIWAILIIFNIIGSIGFFLILYGFAHEANPTKYSLGIIDDTVLIASQIMALIGVAVTTYSIYFPLHTRPPHPGSYFVVWFIMMPLLVLGGYKLVVVGHIPELSINGFALLGFAGAVFRLLPYTFKVTSEPINP